ncbi:hypothetical protein Tco_1065470 [Tanacetum coccineum]
MAVLDSCPKHNMVAYLEKTEGNAEFHEIIDFLTRSSIHHALTVSPVVSTTFVEQFWTSAKSKIINNVRHITAKVAGKPVSISEASIRSDLLFDDANGIDSLPNQAIFDAIQLMGSKSTSWDQIPTNIATAVICLTSNQKYNFSKLIFDGMLRHLDAKKKFVMYPRFISRVSTDSAKHNMVAYLEKSEGNAEFHEIIDFLTRSSIHHALTVSPVVSTTFVEQFWTSAKSKIINNVRHITVKVAGKSVSISEASIRSDLLFDDANGIDSLPNQAIFDAIQLIQA